MRKKAQAGDTIKVTRTIGDTAAVNRKLKAAGMSSPSFKSSMSRTDSLLNERMKAKKSAPKMKSGGCLSCGGKVKKK